VKPIGVARTTLGMHNTWEPLIVVPGRELQPGFRDWLAAQPARLGGELKGRKPIAFCAWLFRCLGLVAGDELVDLFPGTGIVGRAWRELSRSSTSDASRQVLDDASPAAARNGYPSPLEPRDASSSAADDASTPAASDGCAA
jgi:hypothetical protein